MESQPHGLFGRDRELAEADVTLATAASGTPQALLIGGDAGIGKTSLVNEVARRAAELGFTVLTGHCLDVDTGVPFGPVREALRVGVSGRTDESLPPVTRRLAPFLRAHAGPGVDSPTALLEGLCLVVAELAREQPLMLVLEDMHWADRSTQDFAVAMAGTMRSPLQFVLTYRRDELTRRHPLRRALVEIGRGSAAVHLDLEPLDRGGIAGIVRSVTGSDDSSVVGSLLARSEGNPLFAEELLASHRDGVPDHLSDLLLARIDSLTPATRDLLRLASVDGSRIDRDLLCLAAHLEPADIDACLREGVDANVITSAGDHLDFRHGLLREAVHDDLMPGERTRAHSRLAAAIQAQMDSEPTSDVAALGRLAFHRYAAHELPEAFAASVRAGLAAKDYGGHDAIAHLERALDLWDRVPEPMSLGGLAKADVLRLLCEVCDAHGDRNGSLRYILAAMEQLGEDSDPLLASRVYSTYGLSSVKFAGHNSQRDILEKAVEYAEGEPSQELAKALYCMSNYQWRLGSAGSAIEFASRAAEIARVARCPHERLRAELVLGAATFDLGLCREGIAHLRKAIEIAESAGQLGQAVGINGQLAYSLMLMGEVSAGREVADAGRIRGLALGFPDDATFNGEQSVQALLIEGRFDEADLLLEELRELGMPELRWRWVRVEALVARGGLETALTLERETMALIGDSVTDSDPAHVVRQADLLSAVGLEMEALERSDSYLSTMADADALLHLALAARAAYAALAAATAAGVKPPDGMPDRAADALNRARAGLTDEWSQTFQAAESLHAVALAHTLEGEPALAEWRAAEAAAAAFGAYHVLRTRLGLVKALLTAGERDEARVLVLDLWQSAREIGARWFEDQSARLARSNRIPLPEEETLPRQLAALTAREREVLDVLATGATNRAIAERLFISEKTVSVHVTNVLAKLGVPNRGEAAALARELANS
jgi:DNA-binding CsgD family transcriptional regulator/tetratricopeptide (TPR) repeat protein